MAQFYANSDNGAKPDNAASAPEGAAVQATKGSAAFGVHFSTRVGADNVPQPSASRSTESATPWPSAPGYPPGAEAPRG